MREGEVLAGKYRVERVLGAGGMGVVVAAHHVDLGTKVAIKFLLPSMLANQESVARFAREARAAAKITSEHVARVFDVGTLPNGAPYMVLEYLEGGDLAAWLKQRGPLPIEQAIDFVLQACVAVADAHALGIVHRDLKPANLFCVQRSDGRLSIKVLDFGISKVSDGAGSAAGAAMTQTSAVMGSPLYMSPEQMQSAKDVDAGTDIWALGVILFELLTGRVPFEGETVAQLAVAVATRHAPSVRSARPDVPPEVESVICRCLEKDRGVRYRNVAELARALADFAPKRARASVERILGIIQAAGLSASALELPPSPAPLSSGARASGATVAAMGRTTGSPPVRKTPKGYWLAAVVAAVATSGVLVIRGLRVRVPRTTVEVSTTVRPLHPSPPAAASAAALAPPPPSPPGAPPAERQPPSLLPSVPPAASPAQPSIVPLLAAPRGLVAAGRAANAPDPASAPEPGPASERRREPSRSAPSEPHAAPPSAAPSAAGAVASPPVPAAPPAPGAPPPSDVRNGGPTAAPTTPTQTPSKKNPLDLPPL